MLNFLRAIPAVLIGLAACSSSSSNEASSPPGIARPHDNTIVPAPACTNLVAQPSEKAWTLVVDGVTRTFVVNTPAKYNPSSAMPLVFNFHGFQINPALEEWLTQMRKKAESAGFVLVYPEGTGSPLGFNGGHCCGEAAAKKVDDVKFTAMMIDTLQKELCIDKRRIFATGMSNGGFLSYRLACEMSSVIAAIGPVGATMGVDTCNPTRAVPVIAFNGTADPLVSYYNAGSLTEGPVPSTIAGWVKRDQCSPTPKETFRDHDSHCDTYSSCAGGAEVVACTIDGGGHTWPGGSVVPGDYGVTTKYLSANDAMWAFFEKHPLP